METTLENNYMNIVLLDDSQYNYYSLIPKYEEFLELQEGVLRLKNLDFCRVWNGCGTINCHTYPIIRNQTDIVQLVNDVYDIVKMIKQDKNIQIKHEYRDDWSSYDIGIGSHPLQPKNKDNINLYTLIAYMILLYGKQRAIYKIGKTIHKFNDNCI